MKNIKKNKMKLVLSVGICSMFIAVIIPTTIGIQITDDNILGEVPPIEPDGPHGPWNFWKNRPHIFNTNEGNVGIGISEPQGKLHISSDSSSWGMLRLENSNPGDNEVSISFKDGNDAPPPDIWIAGVGAWGNNKDFVIGRWGVKLLIDYNGNVGIGTIDPDGKLDVDFGVTGSLVASTPLGRGPGVTFYAPNGNRRDICGMNDLFYIGASPDSGPPDDNDLFFLLENGNVGIGTPVAGERLHIWDSTPIIRFEEMDYGNKIWHIGGYNAGFVISEPGSGDWLFVEPGGDVGIGTNTPDAKLEVAGTVHSTSGGFKFPDDSVQVTAASGDGHSLDAADGSPTDVVEVDNNGDTTVTGDLHVNGDITFNDKTSYLSIAPAAFSPRNDETDHTNWGESIQSNDADYFVAPVYLPQGAVIKTITYHFWDDTTDADTLCDFYTADFQDNEYLIASCESSSDPGFGSDTESCGNYVVNNEAECFYVQVYLHHINTAAYGVVIEYTIDELCG
jgi:hypothetical protein